MLRKKEFIFSWPDSWPGTWSSPWWRSQTPWGTYPLHSPSSPCGTSCHPCTSPEQHFWDPGLYLTTCQRSQIKSKRYSPLTWVRPASSCQGWPCPSLCRSRWSPSSSGWTRPPWRTSWGSGSSCHQRWSQRSWWTWEWRLITTSFFLRSQTCPSGSLSHPGRTSCFRAPESSKQGLPAQKAQCGKYETMSRELWMGSDPKCVRAAILDCPWSAAWDANSAQPVATNLLLSTSRAQRSSQVLSSAT